MPSDSTTLLPLTMLPLRRPARIVEVRAGRRLKERLAGLGIAPGNTVEVLNDSGGPLLLAVGEARLALGRGMAHKVLVQTFPGVSQGSARV